MGQIYILAAIFLWSSLGIVIRFSGVQVHVFTFWSLVVAVIVQGLVIWIRGYAKEITGIRKLGLPVLLGFIGLVNSLTFFYALKSTTISNAVLTHYTAPVMVAFLAAIFLKEKITRHIVAAIVMASLGLYVMLDGLSVSAADLRGVLSGLASGVAYALIIIIARLFAREFRPFMIAFIVNITIVVLLAPFIREVPVKAFWSYLVMGIVHSTIAPALYYRGMQEVSAGRTAVLGYLEPVCAILLGMVFLGEMPGTYSIFGGILILGSGYLTIMSKT